MENNTNFKKVKRHIKSVEQAKITLDILLQDPEKYDIEKGISALLDELKNPKLDLIMNNYPDFLKKYSLEKLLSGNIDITYENKQDVKTSGLLLSLQLLTHFCGKLKENPTCADNRIDILYILNSITFSRFISELLIIVVSVVGKSYYKEFQQRIKCYDFEIEIDPELDKYYDFMIWFALSRLFLESVYTCFINED